MGTRNTAAAKHRACVPVAGDHVPRAFEHTHSLHAQPSAEERDEGSEGQPRTGGILGSHSAGRHWKGRHFRRVSGRAKHAWRQFRLPSYSIAHGSGGQRQRSGYKVIGIREKPNDASQDSAVDVHVAEVAVAHSKETA